ncbi:hypothetical protein [Tuwongella immobilis]|nr:hypothetical protein [Tuwongella immobilis]
MPRPERSSLNDDTPRTNPEIVVPEAPESERVKIDQSLFWFQGVEDDQPIRSQIANEDEFQAYNYVMLFAKHQDDALLDKYARRNVPLANLIREVRKDYYRELLHFQGRLKFVRTLKPTLSLQAEGVREMYEGWIIPDNDSNLLCVLFLEKPEGIKLDVELDSVHVRVNGYFFKLMRYESKEKNPKTNGQIWRRAPLLMAKSLTFFTPVSTKPDASEFKALAALLAGGMLLTTIILVVIFRRSDRVVRDAPAVQSIQKNPFDEESESATKSESAG